MAPGVLAEVGVSVYYNDANTPLALLDPDYPNVYTDIMVGTRLSIIVDSNVGELWTGSLAIEDLNMDYGALSCRECNEVFLDCDGSILPAAGDRSMVQPWLEPGISGYDLYTHSRQTIAGTWFAIDYTATGAGVCSVGFYDHSVDFFEPVYLLTFSHVPARDFNDDTVANFSDLAVLLSHWQTTGCGDPGWCEGADLDRDRDVDFDDVRLFSDYWLEKTELSDVEYCTTTTDAASP
jgi:hypothetical protein